NGSNSAFYIQADGHRGIMLLVQFVDIAAAVFAEPRGVDAADSTLRIRNQGNIFRQINRGFSDAASNVDVVVLLMLATQIEFHFAYTHVEFDAADIRRAKIQRRFSDAELEVVVDGHSVIEFDIPQILVFPAPGATFTIRLLLDLEVASKSS